jgi:hypothetical protein
VTLAFASFALAKQLQLNYASGAFTIKDGSDAIEIPLSAAEPREPLRADRLNLRLGDTLITFDKRGLGIQYGSKGGFTKLAYVATSPLLFDAEEIERTKRLISEGRRSADVSALSGFEVVNDRIFLLMRWDGADDDPWLEALIDLDTSGDAPKVGVISRFGGFSFAKGPVSDELYSRDTRLFTPLRATFGLALGLYDTAGATKRFVNLGGAVDSCIPLGQNFLTTTKTSYGMTSIGYIDTKSERWRAVFETRGLLLPTPLDSAIRVKEGGFSFLFDVETGAKSPLSATTAVAKTPYGILVWDPADKPTTATLREQGTLLPLAEWKKA